MKHVKQALVEVNKLEKELADHREYKQLIHKQEVLKQQLFLEKVGKNICWKTEAPNIRDLSIAGMTDKAIGDKYGVSKAWIGRVLRKYFPDLTSDKRGKAVIHKAKRDQYLKAVYEKKGLISSPFGDKLATDLANAMQSAFTRKRQNAKQGKWEWLISPKDVYFPTHCPMLGMELDWFAEYRGENSPSFDRIDATKGYIPGNVIICSWRANRIKNDGTAKEHRQIAEYLEKTDSNK